MKKLYVFSLTMFFVFGAGMASSYGQAASSAVDLASIEGEAPPKTATTSYVKSDCDTAPGLIITDDGSIENGYSGNPNVVSSIAIVERFSITDPGQLAKVCLAFLTFADGNLDVEVVVFDDDGTDGDPGTELASLPVSLSGIPAATPPAPYPLVWHDIDLTSLDLTLGSGYVYIGARWEPDNPNTFLAADESPETPLAEGRVQMDSGWDPIQVRYPDYRSMFIRPQVIPADTPPVPVPFANWALYSLVALILGFVVIGFRRVF